MRSFQDKVAVVTGAASGIGRALAQEEHSLDDWRWIVGVNFWGVVHGCKFFLPHLRKNREAHIVNLSSMLGFIGMPTQSSYCATKFAVRGLSEALWAELHGSGIGVTSVHPGGVKTNIVRASRSADAFAKQQMAERIDRMAMAPEKVALKILRAVERNDMRVVICAEAHITEWVKRLAPVRVHPLVAYAYRRFGSLG